MLKFNDAHQHRIQCIRAFQRYRLASLEVGAVVPLMNLAWLLPPRSSNTLSRQRRGLVVSIPLGRSSNVVTLRPSRPATYTSPSQLGESDTTQYTDICPQYTDIVNPTPSLPSHNATTLKLWLLLFH